MANLLNFVNDTLLNGGASYNIVTGEYNPDNGYMVATQGNEQIFENVDNAKQVQYMIANYIKDNTSKLLGGVVSNNFFLGSWINDGKLYLDISIKMTDKIQAINLAKDNKQLAIWDCANHAEIVTV